MDTNLVVPRFNSSKMNSPTIADASSREDKREAKFGAWYFRGSAAWWLVVGLVMGFAAFDDTLLDHERTLKWPDVVFGFSTKNVLLLACGFHLVLGGVLFAIRDTFTKVLLLVWGSSVCAIYRLGFSWLDVGWLRLGDPCPVVRLTADKIGINPKLFGFGWGLILGGMVFGAMLVLLLERRRRKRVEESAFMENWRKTHKDGSPFPWAG